MQTIQILALGKCKESYLRDACREYEKRLSRFCQLQVTELEPVSLPQNPSEKEIAAALEKEGAELLKRAKGFCIAMCIEGKQLDSPGLAKKLEQAAQGADLLLCDATYALPEQQEQAAQWGHSTFGQSAALAAKAGAKRLWLVHYSPMVTDPEEHLAQAQSIFPAAECGFDGKRITLHYEENEE